jgi:hypothetical protein
MILYILREKIINYLIETSAMNMINSSTVLILLPVIGLLMLPASNQLWSFLNFRRERIMIFYLG